MFSVLSVGLKVGGLTSCTLAAKQGVWTLNVTSFLGKELKLVQVCEGTQR